MIFVGFYGLYVSKIVNFGRCINLLQEKCKVASFNLAHPVHLRSKVVVNSVISRTGNVANLVAMPMLNGRCRRLSLEQFVSLDHHARLPVDDYGNSVFGTS